MTVTVQKQVLANALGLVGRVVPARHSIPSLTLLRLDVQPDSLRLTGTDMNVDIEVTIPNHTNGGEPQSYALPGALLAQVVKVAPNDEIELRFGKQLTVQSGNYKSNIQLADPDELGDITFPTNLPGEVDATAFAKALTNVRYAAATADYQAIFRGVLLEPRGETTRIVASDGFRLAYETLNHNLGFEKPVVIPARHLDHLLKILSEGSVKLGVARDRLTIQGEHFKFNTTLMEGTFPDYERIIPTAFPITINVNAKALHAAVNRVSLLADKQSNNRVDLHIKDGILTLISEGPQGRSREQLDVTQEGTDPEAVLSFNAKYLVDALTPLPNAALNISTNTSPTVFKDPNGDSNYLAMVVPLRTNN